MCFVRQLIIGAHEIYKIAVESIKGDLVSDCDTIGCSLHVC